VHVAVEGDCTSTVGGEPLSRARSSRHRKRGGGVVSSGAYTRASVRCSS
jgi:hypothetical protein